MDTPPAIIADGVAYCPRIDQLEAVAVNLPKAAILTEHLFTDGFYTRKITVPAGTFISGYTHTESCLNAVPQGHLRLYTEDGGTRDLVAPCLFVSPAGTRRAALALSDTIYITRHPNPDNGRDVAALEARLVVKHGLPVALHNNQNLCHLSQ